MIIRKKHLLYIATILLVSVLFLQYRHNSVYREVNSFALKVPTEHKKLTMKDALLYRFWIITLYNPVMALPGTDLSELSKSIASIRDSRNKYINFYSKKDREIILKNIHPINFLESLPSLEKQRRRFIKDPTYKNAESYNDKLQSNLSLLSTYINHLRSTLEQFKKYDFDMSFPGGITSLPTVTSTLAKMNDEVVSQMNTVSNRSKCLSGVIKNKTTCKITIPKLVIAEGKDKGFSLQRALLLGKVMKDYLHNGRESQMLSLTNKESRKLPLVYIPESSCARATDSVYIFTWRRSRNEKGLYIWTSPVDELLFHDFRNRDDTFSKTLYKVGTSYEFQPMNPYFCIDSTKDTGKVRTAYYIQNLLTLNPVLGNYSLNQKRSGTPDIYRAQKAETQITSEDHLLYVSDIENYIGIIQNIVYSKKDYSHLNQSEILKLLHIITLWRSQSPWLESEFNRIDDMSLTTFYVSKIVNIPLMPLLITRGYFSPLLLSSNATLFNKPISYLKNTTPMNLQKSKMVTYSDTISKFVPISELPKFMRKQNDYSYKAYSK